MLGDILEIRASKVKLFCFVGCLSVIVVLFVLLNLINELNNNIQGLNYLINEQNYNIYVRLTNDLRSIVIDLNFAQSLLGNNSVDYSYFLCHGGKLRSKLEHLATESYLLYMYFSSTYYKTRERKHRLLAESFDALRKWAVSEVADFDRIIREHNLGELSEWLSRLTNYTDSLSALSSNLDNARINVLYTKRCKCLSEISEEDAVTIFKNIQKLLRT